MSFLGIADPVLMKNIDESAVPKDGLLLYYDAGDPKSYIFPSSTWFNLSSQKNNGTFAGTVTFLRTYGGIMSFSSGQINIGTPIGLTGLQVPLTICSWFYPTSAPAFSTIYSQYSATTANRLISLLRIDSGVLIYDTSKNDGTIQAWSTGLSPALNNWHFVAVNVVGSVASATATMYLDSRAPVSNTFPSPLSSTPDITVPIFVGRTGPGEFFVGNMGSVFVYNRALNANEISKLRKATKGRFYVN